LRRQAGLLAPERSAQPGKTDSRFGVRRHFQQAPWTDLVEVHWGPECEAYITPIGPEEIGVALLWSGGKATFDDLLGRLPRVEERLHHAFATSRDRGTGPLKQRAVAVSRGRLALVGDAAGYLDAITGEGLALALNQAFVLVEAISKNNLRHYRRACRRVTRLPDLITAGVLAAERRPWLRRRLMRTLAAEPRLFDRLLGVHAGTLTLKDLGLGGMTRLARGLMVSHGT
jgi:flavin-dependent dehydrogenase